MPKQSLKAIVRLLRRDCPERHEILRYAQNDRKRRAQNDRATLRMTGSEGLRMTGQPPREYALHVVQRCLE